MLHLSPESGLWLPCPEGDDGKCELKYHAPVGEGEVSYSLLMETYASEELYREPDEILPARQLLWRNKETGTFDRNYGLPSFIHENVFYWYDSSALLGYYNLYNKQWTLGYSDRTVPEGAYLYVASFT